MADNMVASSSRQPAENVSNNERFQGKHRDYIASKIEDIWRCLVGEHYLCILTAEGEHHQLQPEDVQLWVDAIQVGEATVRNPPPTLVTKAHQKVNEEAEGRISFGPRNLRYTPPITRTSPGVGSKIRHAFEQLWYSAAFGDVNSAFRKWKKDMNAWDEVWNIAHPSPGRSRLRLEGNSEFKLSDLQKRAWAFAMTLNSDLAARVASENDFEDEEVSDLAWMLQVLAHAINQFSTVNAKHHPPASILNEVQHAITLTDYEVLVHFTIVFLAFNLICSKPSLYTLDMVDVALFRVLLHAITNPNVRFPPKIFDILLNLTAIRESIRREGKGFALHRPYEVAVFALCISSDARFLPVLEKKYGITGLIQGLEFSQQSIAKQKTSQVSSMLWLRIYKTLHAIYDTFLQVPGLLLDLDMVIVIMKQVLLNPPKPIKKDFRRILIDAIAAVVCGTPGIFDHVFPYQKGTIRLCLDVLRVWTEAEEDEARKGEMTELCQFITQSCFT